MIRVGGPALPALFTDTEQQILKVSGNKLYADWYNADGAAEIKKHRIFESFEDMDNYMTTISFGQGNDYGLYFVADDGANHGGSKQLPKIPFTIAGSVELACIFWYV